MYLDELALKYRTDKGSYYHNYTQYYDLVFNKIKENSLKVLEIGINRGSSLKMWKEYFTNSFIYGIDNHSSCKTVEEYRIKVFIGSQDNQDFLTKVKTEINDDIDIIIDDGSHMSVHQITSFKILFPFVRSGGFYVIEDLHASYMTDFNKGSNITGLNFCKTLIDEMNLNGKSQVANKKNSVISLEKRKIILNYCEKNIEYIFFFPSLCIIKKV